MIFGDICCVSCRIRVNKKQEKLTIFKYFCNFALSHADDAQERVAWGGAVHTKRRLLRFGFDVLKSQENFKNVCQKQSNVNAPGMCLYIFLLVSCSHWCILTSVESMRCRYGVYTYRRGACVARFDRQGNFLRASEREASNSAGLHAFFMSSL